jgi:hypothetical protein
VSFVEETGMYWTFFSLKNSIVGLSLTMMNVVANLYVNVASVSYTLVVTMLS